MSMLGKEINDVEIVGPLTLTGPGYPSKLRSSGHTYLHVAP